MSVKIICCYAHEDEALLHQLKTHLRPLQRLGLIDIWYDRDISAGVEWEHEISQQLNTAQIILLLVSPDFMDSDYCYGIEMTRAIERHERGEARVIPILLRHVYWQETVLGKLQALPKDKDARPVTDPLWHNLDIGFYNVVIGIRQAINELPVQSTSNKSQEIKEQSQKTKEQWIEKGKKFLNLQRYEKALSAFEEASHIDYDDRYVYICLAFTLSKLNRNVEALTLYERVFERILRCRGCPNVLQLDLLEAMARVTEIGLRIVVIDEYETDNKDFPPGLIARQYPTPGTLIDQGGEIQVVLSKRSAK